MLTAILGWLGTLGMFGSYALLARGRLTAHCLRYALMNAAGGVAGGTAAVLYGAWPSAASNFAWAAVGLHATALYLLRRHRRTNSQIPLAAGSAYSRPELATTAA